MNLRCPFVVTVMNDKNDKGISFTVPEGTTSVYIDCGLYEDGITIVFFDSEGIETPRYKPKTSVNDTGVSDD